MTTQTVAYTRREPVVWRDTGVHVVAKSVGGSGIVVVIGGGAAHLWRLLQRPRTVDEIVTELHTAGQAPDHDEVHSILGILEAHGLVDRAGD